MGTNRLFNCLFKIAFSIIFVSFSTFVSAQIPPIVYVSSDGTGNYNCDGTSDQEQINQALDFVASNANYTTVYLKSGNTYWIDEPIIISSNMKLTGDSNTRVQLVDNAEWPPNKPMITQKGGQYWDSGTLNEQIYGDKNDSIYNVEISGFELSGGKQTQPTGKYYVILMIFYSPSNLTVHDMHMHHSRGDFIRIMSPEFGRSKNIKFYNNLMESSGHDGLYLVYINDLKIYDNEIYSTRTNDGIRIEECNNISVYGNTIGNSLDSIPSGYAGIMLANSTQPIGPVEVYDNYIYGKAGGIVLESGPSKDNIQNVHIHHNRIYKIFNNTAGGGYFLNGGIHIHGAHNTLIEFNTIDGSYKDGIVFEIGNGSETGYKTIVRNNIITNCKGYGINNIDSDVHMFICGNNIFYNNALGDCNNASSTTDVH